MPRLVKGGKWVYGWVEVGPGSEVVLFKGAWDSYGFQEGEEVIFLPGSRETSSTGNMSRKNQVEQVTIAGMGAGCHRPPFKNSSSSPSSPGS